MLRGTDPVADWRDPEAYAALFAADRSLFAWEWLRRDPAYRTAARSAQEARPDAPRPELWGLHAFERPERAPPDARPMWTAETHPYVLRALAAGPDVPSDLFDIARLGPVASILTVGTGGEHLLLSDGLRVLRVDIVAGSVADKPVRLRYLIDGLASAEPPLLTLRRLIGLCRTGRFSRSLHCPETRARRWVLMLRTHDALAAGADQREIASVLVSRAADETRWRSNASSVRSQVQRLVRAARCMAAGGYRGLLR